MNELYDVLIQEYGVRKNKQEKAKFREFAKDYFESLGYDVVIQNSIFGKNVIVGDITSNNVVLAHYDTPGNNRFIMLGSNKLGVIIPQIFFMIFFFFTIGVINGITNSILTFPIGAVIVLYLLIFTKNKHNVNDNTSGVVSVMKLAKRMKNDNLNNVLFVLCDNEEKGLFGAYALKRYLKKRKALKNKKYIALDCVAHGSYILISRSTSKMDLSNEVETSFNESNTEYNIVKRKSAVLMSDHAVFGQAGVLIAGVDKTIFNGYTIKNIHNKFDDMYDIDFIKEINNNVFDYLKKLQ